MKNNHTFRVEDLGELILLMFDGTINDQERSVLQDQITTNPAALEYYHNFIITYIGLREGQVSAGMESAGVIDTADEPVLSEQVWRTLANEECTADPVIPEQPDRSDHQLIRKIEHVKIERRPKSSFALLAASIAAVIVFVLFVHLTPVRESHGQLTDTFNAVFDKPAAELQPGRYLGSDSVILKKGLARIQMDDGSSLLMEAPSELRLEADDQVFLIRGKVTASVPPEAIGFMVRTPTASIVDYGTEFGVSCDQHAQTETHVLKGNVEVRLGSNSRVFEKAIRLSANQAGRVSGEILSAIPANVTQFTYELPTAFETSARALNPVLYFRFKAESINTFCEVMGKPGINIRMGSDRQIASGPLLNPDQNSGALRMDGLQALDIDNVLPVFTNETGDFTVACWVRFDDIQPQIIWAHRVVNTTTSSGMRETYDRTLWINKAGQLEHLALFTENSADLRKVNVIAAPIALQPHQWYFISVTHAMGKHKSLYINGQLAARSTSLQDSVLEKYSRLAFGPSVSKLAPGLKGAITDILFYNRDLSDTENKKLYESAATDQ